MAPRRSKKTPAVTAEVPGVQVVEFSISEDVIYVQSEQEPQQELQLDTQLKAYPESHPESQSSQLPTITENVDNTSNTTDKDQLDRIEWTAEMIHTLFTELLEQAQDGKRADSGFKKEAWDSVLKEVQAVYTGPYTIPLQKVKQKEQTFKRYYKDWKFLRDQSGFGWDEETAMITAPDQAWDDVIAVSNSPSFSKDSTHCVSVASEIMQVAPK